MDLFHCGSNKGGFMNRKRGENYLLAKLSTELAKDFLNDYLKSKKEFHKKHGKCMQ